jgi:AcrR family transcriptional regulator
VERKKRGRPPRAEAGPQAVEERILDSACQLFYSEGVNSVGIDRVLAQAGAAKASLYAHYPSKDALVAAYLKRRAEQSRDSIRARLAAGPADARSRILGLFDLMLEFSRGEGFRGCPFLNASSELADTDHPAREVVRQHRQWLHDLVHGLVAEARVRDVERLTRAILVLYDGAASSTLADGNPAAVEDARWAAARLLDAAAGRPRVSSAG